jgi:uncharacterized protein (DUF2236 family)
MRFGPPRRPARVVDLINPAAVLLPAANVIMQLSAPGVGYGVLESPVDSGNVYKHPFKRARTTGTYLAAATLGTDADRALIRDEVDKVHALVRSQKSSPVSYNAFDPRLQLWVAACLYRYYRFLPAEFRSHMQLPWTSGQQRRFEWLLSVLRIADRVIPRDVWILGYRLYLRDMRARARRGRRIV